MRIDNINDSNIYHIATTGDNNWFCKKCGHKHNDLYYVKGSKYCPSCVPENIKNNAIKINANREEIE